MIVERRGHAILTRLEVVLRSKLVDERAVLRKAEKSRARVAGLRVRADGAAIDIVEGEREKAARCRAVLVEADGEADGFFEVVPPNLRGEDSGVCRYESAEIGCGAR